MNPFHSRTVAEQLAEHFRREMEEGRMSGIMPGVLKLEAETGMNRKTVETALRLLERDGLLLPQGAGKRRLIAPDQASKRRAGLRIGILCFDGQDVGTEAVWETGLRLEALGHAAINSPETLTSLRMDVGKVARLAQGMPADAWIVIAASREVLEWFIGRDIPVMAVYGRRRGLPLASVGPDKSQAYQEATRTLLSLGHRRIVWLTRRVRRWPKPGEAERIFLNELATHGITPGSYNLPDWQESRTGFNDLMESLFRLTPPTAIVADEARFYFAARNFLAARGLSVPGDVSMICTDGDPNFEWCTPSVAHIHWDHRPLVRRVVQWVENLSQGKEDLRHTFLKAEFVPGGTIGPAKRG